jgi:predicted amidophosphoribosyltransferase
LSVLLRTVFGVLLTRRCTVCGAAGRPVCDACLLELRPAPAAVPPAGVSRCWALLAYDGAGRELIARVKYRNQRGALAGVAVATASLVDVDVDVVTWAPTTTARRRDRGFDQSKVIAATMARALGVRCRPLLRRVDGPPQTGRSSVERRAGPVFVATAAPSGRVLVVDDVITTGASLRAAATALRRAGADDVVAAAVARTPRDRVRRPGGGSRAGDRELESGASRS